MDSSTTGIQYIERPIHQHDDDMAVVPEPITTPLMDPDTLRPGAGVRRPADHARQRRNSMIQVKPNLENLP